MSVSFINLVVLPVWNNDSISKGNDQKISIHMISKRIYSFELNFFTISGLKSIDEISNRSFIHGSYFGNVQKSNKKFIIGER